MTATITAKNADLQDLLKLLACPLKGQYLFNPIRVNIADGRLTTKAESQAKTSFVEARASVGKMEGTADAVLDIEQLLKFLDLYGADEEVVVSLGDTITVRTAKKAATIFPDQSAAVVVPNVPQVVDGKVTYKTGAATTVVHLKASELADLVEDARVVEVATFPLHFAADGSSAALGSGEAKKNSVLSRLDAKVEGAVADTVVGEDLAFVFANVAGDVVLQLKAGDAQKARYPLYVIRSNPLGTFAWTLLPREVAPS